MLQLKQVNRISEEVIKKSLQTSEKKKKRLMLNRKNIFDYLLTEISMLISLVIEQRVIVGCTTIYSTYNNVFTHSRLTRAVVGKLLGR